MEPDKYVRLETIADEGDVTPSTIYHYIKKGLLPKPKQMPTPKGRGAWAVYPKSFVEAIKQIRKKLKQTHSIDQVKRDMEKLVPEKKRRQIIQTEAQKLEKLATEGRCDSEEYRKAADFFNTATQSSLAIYFYMLENK